MTIDWRKELSNIGRIYWWYMKVGFISIPFGIIYACLTMYLGYESVAVLLPILAAAIFAVYKIQGMPPKS